MTHQLTAERAVEETISILIDHFKGQPAFNAGDLAGTIARLRDVQKRIVKAE